MSFLKNAGIRTKILSLIIPLCVVGAVATTYVAVRYKAANTTYANFIATDNVATVEMARANRNLVACGYGAYQALVYSGKDTGFKVAQDFYMNSRSQLFARLDHVKASLPDRAAAIDPLINRTKEIIALTDEAVRLGQTDDDDKAKALLSRPIR